VQTLKDGEVPVDAGAGADYILVSGVPELLRLSHVFQDVVLTVRRTEPDLPLVTTFNDWSIRPVRGLGRPVDMGLR
jgi:hypothetical protein